MRVVLDTNVIISALNFPGNERLVLELALRGRFEFYLSLFILEEVARVLVRKFDWDEERSAQAIQVIENAATVIDPSPRRPSTPGSPATVRTWTSPWPPSFGPCGTTPRTTATPWPASTWTRPRAAALPIGPSSAG